MSLTELTGHREAFPGLSNERKRVIADNLTFAEATFGDRCACRMCYIKAPVGLHGFMPSSRIVSIHNFIRDYGTQHGRDKPLMYHHRGQLSDYFDPETGWDMADVVIDGLRTDRTIYVYLHGIDPSDERALSAALRIQALPEEQKKRIKIVVSTDPFGPCNVPEEQAEAVGKDRSKQALVAFHGLPHLTLNIFYADLSTKDIEIKKAKDYFGLYLPESLRAYSISLPTRVPLPVGNKLGLEYGNGYGLTFDSQLLFKQYLYGGEWMPIANWNNIDERKILEPDDRLVI